jgi:hypothetical protein
MKPLNSTCQGPSTSLGSIIYCSSDADINRQLESVGESTLEDIRGLRVVPAYDSANVVSEEIPSNVNTDLVMLWTGRSHI